MIFGRDTNFLFDHLPKTGGTAFRKVLENLFGMDNVSPNLEGRSEIWAIRRYSQLRVISGHFLSHVPADLNAGGRARITVLRHPIERAISEYYYWRHHAFEGVDDRQARWAQAYDICTYFRMREESNETSATDFYTKHFATRLSRQMNDRGSMLALAKRALAAYKFVGISEQMSDSVDVFCWRFGLPAVKEVPRENVTSVRVGLDRLDPESYGRLMQMNELDLELYEAARTAFEAKKRRVFRELLIKKDVRRRRRFLGGAAPENTMRRRKSPAGVNRLAVLARQLMRRRGDCIAGNGVPPQRARPSPVVIRTGPLGIEEIGESFGDGAIAINTVGLRGVHSGTNAVAPGEVVVLTLVILAHTDEPNLTVGIDVRDGFGEIVFGTNTFLRHLILSVSAGRQYEVRFGFRANLNRGRYRIGAALHTGADHLERCYEWRSEIAQLDIVQLGEPDFIGYCRLEPSIEWRELPVVSVRSGESMDTQA